MSDTTVRFSITEPSADRHDSADVPLYIRNVVQAIESLAAIYGYGTLNARPAAGKVGRFYIASDLSPQKLYFDTGATWLDMSTLGAGVIGTTQLADDAVTAAKIAADAVGASEIAAGAVGTPELADSAVTLAKVAAALIPSQGAAGAAEALRALGTAAGQAAPGSHAAQHGANGPDPLVAPPLATAALAANQTIPNGGALAAWAAWPEDTNVMGGVANLIVIKTAGLYLITAGLSWNDNSVAAFQRGLELRKNGTGVDSDYRPFPVGTGFIQSNHLTRLVRCLVNDQISVYANQNTGGNQTLLAASATYLSALRVSP